VHELNAAVDPGFYTGGVWVVLGNMANVECKPIMGFGALPPAGLGAKLIRS